MTSDSDPTKSSGGFADDMATPPPWYAAARAKCTCDICMHKRIDELRAEIAGIEASGAASSEPVLALLRAQLREVESLYRATHGRDWRERAQNRGRAS